jgi:hypothetical protein
MKIEIKMYCSDESQLLTALENVVQSLKNCDMGTVKSDSSYLGSFARLEDADDVTDLDTGIHW